MALKLKKPAPGKATVTKETKSKGETIAEESHEEEVPNFAGDSATGEQLCEVGVEMSYTQNLGNYQSARFAVTLKVPCPHDDIDAVYDGTKEWVETKLNGLIEEANSE